jgi:hypothetical protein
MIVSEKTAPAKLYHFLAELMMDMALRGKVESVEVAGGSYVVTLSRHDGSTSTHELSAYDMSRSMRGNPDAVAAIRSQLLGQVSAA